MESTDGDQKKPHAPFDELGHEVDKLQTGSAKADAHRRDRESRKTLPGKQGPAKRLLHQPTDADDDTFEGNRAKLTVGLCCPAVRRLERNAYVWLLFGATDSDCQRLLATSPDRGNSVEQDICIERGDASLIRISSYEGQPQQITLWRGLSSSYQLFFSIVDGGVLVSDSFRYVVACLPSSCRAISSHALVDHFLFGQVPGTDTYAEAVQKVAHGQEVTIDLGGPSVTSQLFDRVRADFVDQPTATRLATLDTALADFVRDIATPEDAVMLFSGGLDSTLISSYLGPAVGGLNMRTRTTDLNARLEEEYCQSAANLLGIDCDVMVLKPEEYLDQLVTCIDALGRPPHVMHMVWFNEAFRQQP
ncbi:MAG: asparagine synthase-related protein, partial [Kiloniellales bacterium]